MPNKLVNNKVPPPLTWSQEFRLNLRMFFTAIGLKIILAANGQRTGHVLLPAVAHYFGYVPSVKDPRIWNSKDKTKCGLTMKGVYVNILNDYDS